MWPNQAKAFSFTPPPIKGTLTQHDTPPQNFRTARDSVSTTFIQHFAAGRSAAAFCFRMLSPVPSLGSSFVHQRLVMLYARMGRLEDAEKHLAVLERNFTHPGPDMRHLLEEAWAAVRSARGMARKT